MYLAFHDFPRCSITKRKKRLSAAELLDAEERAGLKEDMLDECRRFGAVEAIKVPLEGNADASVYVRWSRPAEAAAARQSFSGRKFDGRTVEVSLVPEADFEVLNDG